MDFRPADRQLYGLTDANDLYTLDLATGAAKFLGALTVAFDGRQRSGFDFNPQTDRLRLIAANGQNVRAHPVTGAAALDEPLAYAARDPNAGRRPRVTASAYTRSLPRTPSTQLFNIDSELDVLVLQEPPNDGVLTTVGPLGVDFGVTGGFDIISLPSGEELAYAASGATLYRVDLRSGAATVLGSIGSGDVQVVGLTAIPP